MMERFINKSSFLNDYSEKIINIDDDKDKEKNSDDKENTRTGSAGSDKKLNQIID